MIIGVCGKSLEASHGRDVHDDATLLAVLGVLLAHDAQRVQRQAHGAPVVDLHDGAGLGRWVRGVQEGKGGLGVAHEAVACVVDQHVNAAEVGEGAADCGGDGGGGGHVQGEGEDAGRVCEGGEGGGVAGRGHQAVGWVRGYMLGQGEAQA